MQPCLKTQQANPNQIYSKQPNMLSNQSNNKPKIHKKILKQKYRDNDQKKKKKKIKSRKSTSHKKHLELDFDCFPRSIYKTKYPKG